MNTRSLLISAGVGGVVMGLLSGIPIISLGNCVLCLWMWAGGILGVYVYTRMETTPPTTGQGAIIGALAGLFGAIIVSGLSLVFGAAMMGMMSALGDFTSDDMVQSVVSQGVGVVAGFAINIVLYPGIGALAGLIGVELFGKSGRAPEAM